MLLYLAADLIWGTRIKATAAALGITARPVRTLAMLEERLADAPADNPIKGVLLDLEKPEEALAMVARLRGARAADRERAVRIVCWAPHVHRDIMEQAKLAGADRVMTRGAFDAGLERVLQDLESGGACAPDSTRQG